MEYSMFCSIWEKHILLDKPSHIRKGQALMNFLFTVWRDEYKRIVSVHYYDRTDIDCFYNDKLVQNCLEHLESVWKNYPK